MTTHARKPLKIEVLSSSEGQMQGDSYSGVPDQKSKIWDVVDLSPFRENLSQAVLDLAETFKPGEKGPKTCEITFSLKASAEGSIVVSKLGAEANFQVKVVWERPT